jgi:hypothetical protein
MIHHPEAGLGDGSAKNVLGMQPLGGQRRGVISDEMSLNHRTAANRPDQSRIV